MFKKVVSLSNLTLLVALALSSVAAYYSIIGLTAIFAGAVIPVIIMGSILEVGKITTTVWLRKYWHRAGWLIKLYLVPAVIALALLTSMGIFGFLSKAHMEQGVTSGDAQGKVAIYDEKIKTSKDNIDANRKALKQLDEAVDQVMGRSTDEKGADKAVAIRRSQANDRKRLLAEIQAEQATISKLSEERAPLASELRKVEAEVGPIKYIAALIYGDNADANMLEAAVRWVIILLVAVFDPLAIALVLAANQSKVWDDEEPQYEQDDGPINEEVLDQLRMRAAEELPTGELVAKDELFPEPMKFVDHGEHPKDYDEKAVEESVAEIALPEPDPVEREASILEQHPYLSQPFVHFENTTPMVYKPEVEPEPTADSETKILAAGIDVVDRPGDYVSQPEIVTEGVTKEHPLKEVHGNDDYVLVDGRHMRKEAAQSLYPQLFLRPDQGNEAKSTFGIQFPGVASKGDTFVRVDVLPNRVFKFDGTRWIAVNKETSTSYLHNEEYIKHLVTMIESGQYDVELLSDNEKAEIEQYLSQQKG